MTEQSRTTTRNSAGGVGFVRRVVCGTVVAAGVVGALATTAGASDHAVQPATVDVAAVRPMQPPPPPPGWPPPALHQPGQAGPAPGDDPNPPPAEPPIGDPICQDIMDVPDVNAPCYDPSDVA